MKEDDLDVDCLKWKYKNLECKITRNDYGCWCGYVTIPKGHPWLNDNINYPDIDSNVHGGITYLSNEIVGFDCSHCCDLSPKGISKPFEEIEAMFNPHLKTETPTYKNMDFAIKHTEILANEVIESFVKKC